MYTKLTIGAVAALLGAGLALSSPAYTQEQKAPAMSPPAGQGMTMPPEMMARMNKMMDMCEKMMANNDMHKGMMRRHKRNSN